MEGNVTFDETVKLLHPQKEDEKLALNHAQSSGGSNIVLFLSTAAMLLGAISTGTMLALSSPLIPGIENDTATNAIHIGDAEASWIGSLVTLGGMVGGLLAGLIMQSVGRRFTSILAGIPYVGGLLLISYAVNVWMIYIGRFITGIGVAFTSLVVPTYVGEISTHNLRGLLGSGNQLGITLGIFIVYAIGGLLHWRWLVLVIACIPTLYVFSCLFIPETPRHLYSKNKRRQSVAVLQRLRGSEANIADELKELQESLAAFSVEATWKELLVDASIRKPLLLSLASMFFQQFSGINCIMFYAQTIFEDAGFKTASQIHLALILIASVQVLFTLISCVLSDKAGRRILLSISSAIMCISMITFGLYFQLTQQGTKGITWLALASLMIYIASFSIGLGPIPWLLMVELIPIRAKGKCGGLITMFNLFSAFIVTKEFNDMQKAFTTQGTFWVFAGICFLSLIFTLTLLPETKGQSLEEIQKYFHIEIIGNNNYEEIEDANYDSN